MGAKAGASTYVLWFGKKSKFSNDMEFIKKIGMGWDILLKSDVQEGETILGEFISSLVLRLKGIS